jgi:NADH-quinone oxidoreductase subunit N
MGKVMVFKAALQQASENRGLYWLVVIGVLNTAISVYYYLGLIVTMFFRERASQWSAPRVTPALAVALVLAVVGVLYLGIFPNSVINVFQTAQPAVSRLIAP